MARLRFLVEEFIEVPDGEQPAAAVAASQRRAARRLLPGPAKGALSLQQGMLCGMRPEEFLQLRCDVRSWLGALARDPRLPADPIALGPLKVQLVSARGEDPGRLRAPVVEGNPRDVFWYYLTLLVSRAGVSQIGVCYAPRSKRDAGQSDPSRAGETDPCERLFVRRGKAKEFCSERCRARVATQRAREPQADRQRSVRSGSVGKGRAR